MKNSLSITNFIACASIIPVNRSVLIRGDHGIGKSDICRLLAKKLGFSLDDVIDRRLSQVTEGDIIGLPFTDGITTRFNPPDWVKAACDAPKFIFLDELNRATSEVMQAAFQLVLDRELNGHKLHPQTRIYAAVNTASCYTVNEIDPALLSRFFVVDLAPTAEEWFAWARENNVDETIIDFLTKSTSHLDPAPNAGPGEKTTDRRSWTFLSNSLQAASIADKPTDVRYYQLAMCFLGSEAAEALTAYAKNVDMHVAPEDVVKKWKSVSSKVEKFSQDRLNGLAAKLAAYLRENFKDKGVTEAQSKNVAAFYKLLPHELRLHFWGLISEGGNAEIALIKSIHKNVVALLLEVFQMLPGEAGKDMTPVIPEFLANKS
jgi:hypothetical protein